MKKTVFLTALGICVLLVVAIWAGGIAGGGDPTAAHNGGGLAGDEPGQPGSYRSGLPTDADFFLTRTALYENYARGTSTPTPERGGHGRGSGQPGAHDGTPTPTYDWYAREEDQ